MANTIAKINHLNQKKTDGFLDLLRGELTDLNGLPFATGDACRTKGERTKQFTLAVATVRRAMQQGQVAIASAVINASGPPVAFAQPVPPAPQILTVQASSTTAVSDNINPATFWANYQRMCTQEDEAQSKIDRSKCEHITVARVAALMQILAPLSPEYRIRLVKYLAGVTHVEATHALARLAIFSTEDEVRFAACDALKVRRDKDYTEILLVGLRYPLPAVARRSTEAIARLERADLIPQLLTMLEEPDPRAPVVSEVHKKKVPVVREMVKVNHHRSCLLCHAPGNTGTVSDDALTVGVPIPGSPLSPPTGGYNQSPDPDLLIRVDVTYLRQDFLVMQAVAEAHPWPEMQRFDFLVRTRVLSEEEATEYKEKLEPREPGVLSPYHRAALAALRELTGKDTAPTAKAWRNLLKIRASSR